MPPFMKEQQQVGGGCDLSLLKNNKDSYDDSTSNVERIKCVLVGDGAVGKTSLVVSYTTNGYPTEYVPTAYDNYSVIVKVDGRPVRLQLCDTAGQDDFDTLRPLCYPGTDVFLVCFSVVSPTSFFNATEKWIPELRNWQQQQKASGHSTPSVLLVGTQSDLRNNVAVLVELARYGEQPVSEMDARRTAKLIGAIDYIECSALTQNNLKEVFDSVILSAMKSNSNHCNKADSFFGKRLKKTGWRKFFCFS